MKYNHPDKAVELLSQAEDKYRTIGRVYASGECRGGPCDGIYQYRICPINPPRTEVEHGTGKLCPSLHVVTASSANMCVMDVNTKGDCEYTILPIIDLP